MPGQGATTSQYFKEVLASTDLQAKLPGGVLLASGQGVLAKGTVLGKVTATRKFKAYATGASDGSQTSVCILDNDADTTSSDIGASAWIAGIFDSTALTGLDSGAKTALKLCYFV
ncbi:head decoration protein [Paenibacillus sp. HWE-109]|uniref:head decoration protein n=1 Tax=Paenibacillus sp. HWE-109 TaxID=1306526 RepID=UPI001EE0E1D6|nr:head decoration protein [Paenibacillus sp. HWE-109]UKS30052.1 head decoration protein [Paenibacillus sp. HWE-109]